MLFLLYWLKLDSRYTELAQYRFQQLVPDNVYSKHNQQNLEDVLDGTVYNRINQEYGYETNNFFDSIYHMPVGIGKLVFILLLYKDFNFNKGIDGVPLYKSSHVSIWPIVGVDCGLPPKNRYNYI